MVSQENPELRTSRVHFLKAELLGRDAAGGVCCAGRDVQRQEESLQKDRLTSEHREPSHHKPRGCTKLLR